MNLSGQLEAVGWLSGMLCRAAVGECSLSGLEFRVGQVPVGRFGKLSGFKKICGLSGVGQATLSGEHGLRRFGKKACRNHAETFLLGIHVDRYFDSYVFRWLFLQLFR